MDFGEFYHLTVGHTFKAKVAPDDSVISDMCLLVSNARRNGENSDEIEIEGVFVTNPTDLSSDSHPCPCIWKEFEITDDKLFFDEWESCKPVEFYGHYYHALSEITKTIEKHLPLTSSYNHCGMDVGC